MRTAVIGWTLLLIATAACADAHQRSRTVMSDSAGVRIAMTDLRGDPLSPACRVDSVPRVQIGALEGPSEYQLGSIIDATRTSDGRIVVSDRGNHDIRVFDASGKFVRRLGRTGQGPGEFRDPLQVTALGGDSVLMWDPSRYRVIVYGADGRVLRESLLFPPMLNAPERLAVGPGRGRFVAGDFLLETPKVKSTKPQRLQVLRYDETGRLIDTVDNLAHGDIVMTGEREHMIGRPLIPWGARMTANDDRVFLTRGNESMIEVRDSAWKLTNVIRWNEGDRRVTPALLAAARDADLKDARDAAARASIVQYYATTPPSDRVPAVDELKTDPRNRVWVRRYRRPNEAKETWWVFGADGEFDCALQLSPAFRLTEIGRDYLLGVATADAGFERIQLFGLIVGR